MQRKHHQSPALHGRVSFYNLIWSFVSRLYMLDVSEAQSGEFIEFRVLLTG